MTSFAVTQPMTKLGMDAAAIRGFAAQLDAEAHRVLGMVSAIDLLVRHIGIHWTGENAQRFVAEWQGQLRPSMQRAHDSIAGLAASARNNAAAQESVSAVPTAPRLSNNQSATYADGRLRITAHGPNAGHGPRNVRDLLSYLKYGGGPGSASRAYHYPGGITVTLLGTPPHRQVIVAISGTEDWLASRTNIDDATTNEQNFFGTHTAKEDAIREAMIQSGVSPDDEVMLLGHSQGGADAMAFAHDYANDKQFHIAAVVTMGQPPEDRVPPSGVDVLQLRGSADVVPGLGLPWAASERHGAVVIVPQVAQQVEEMLGPTGFAIGATQAHDPATYQADLPTNDRAVVAFEHRHADFFRGGPATTWAFANVRVPSAPALRPPQPVPPITELLIPGKQL